MSMDLRRCTPVLIDDFKIFPDLCNGTTRSNISGATKFCTKYFKSHLNAVLSECASRKNPNCGRLTGLIPKLISLLPYFGSSLSLVVEEGVKIRRTKTCKGISKNIKFEEGSETECLVLVAKAFAKLNIAFYNALYSPDHVVSEASLSCIGSDMVYRFFHYIENLSTGVNIVTEDFIIQSVLKGKSRNRASQLKAKVNPSGMIDRVDGTEVFISKILDLPQYFDPNSDQSQSRLPFRFEDIGKGQEGIDQFWNECEPWVESLAVDVVFKFSDIYNYWAVTLSGASSMNSSRSNLTTPNRSPRPYSANPNIPFEFNVSEQVFNFCGRQKELLILKNVVNFDRKKECVLLLTGCRGVGKSELVRAFTTTFNKGLDGNIIWLQGESDHIFCHSLQNLGFKLQLEEFAPNQESEWSSLVLNRFLHQVIRKLNELHCPQTLFVVDNLESRFALLDETLLYLKKECKSNAFTLITSSYRSIIDCDRLVLNTGLDDVDTERLVVNELERFNASRNPNLCNCVLLLCKRFQNHPLAIRQLLSYLKKIMLLNFTDNLQTFIQNVLDSGGIILEKDREKDILTHKLDILTYNYPHSLENLWELKNLQLQVIDASVLESDTIRSGPLANKFLKWAAYLSIILNSDNVNLRFLKLVLNLSEKTLSKVLNLLNDHCLLVWCDRKEICLPSCFVRTIYIMANQYETAGVISLLLQAIKISVDTWGNMTWETDPAVEDLEKGKNDVHEYPIFLMEFVQYSEAIFSYSQKIPELVDLLADSVSSFLYALRNYEMHQPLVQKYFAFFASNRLNPNCDHRLWAIKLELAYIKMCQGDYFQAELDIQEIVKITATESFSHNVDGPLSPPVRSGDVPPLPPRGLKMALPSRVKRFRPKSIPVVDNSKSEQQAANENRDVRIVKFRALLDLAVVFYKQGDKIKAITTMDVVLRNLNEEMRLDRSSAWERLRAVALHSKNLMEIYKLTK